MLCLAFVTRWIRFQHRILLYWIHPWLIPWSQFSIFCSFPWLAPVRIDWSGFICVMVVFQTRIVDWCHKQHFLIAVTSFAHEFNLKIHYTSCNDWNCYTRTTIIKPDNNWECVTLSWFYILLIFDAIFLNVLTFIWKHWHIVQITIRIFSSDVYL